MEFGSVVWAGAAKTHVQRLERIQHKMLMWLANHSTNPSQSLDYHHLLSHFGVSCIRTRLVQRDLTFLHSLFSGRIKSADIVGMFGLCVPARRTTPFFIRFKIPNILFKTSNIHFKTCNIRFKTYNIHFNLSKIGINLSKVRF